MSPSAEHAAFPRRFKIEPSKRELQNKAVVYDGIFKDL